MNQARQENRQKSPAERALEEQLKDIAEFVTAAGVSEVFCNSDGMIWVERGAINEETDVYYSPEEREAIVRNLAGLQNRQVTPKNPDLLTYVNLWGGVRWTTLMPPVVVAPTINIRIPPRNKVTLDDLQQRGAITASQKQKLSEAVLSRKNIIFCGATGTGKTTFLRAALNLVTQDRMIVVEDTPEIGDLVAKNVQHIQTTPDQDMAWVLKRVLRMTPNRIILGEIRDGEAAWQFCSGATASGHHGSMATVHANSAGEVVSRFRNLIKQDVPGNPDMSTITKAIQVVVFIEKHELRTGRKETKIVRRVGQILDEDELKALRIRQKLKEA